MSMRKPRTKGTPCIPEFGSYAEEARFWDTHDTTDFEAAFTPVHVRVAKKLSDGLTIRLDREALSKVRAAAHAQGVRPGTLIRIWVLERLEQEEASAHP